MCGWAGAAFQARVKPHRCHRVSRGVLLYLQQQQALQEAARSSAKTGGGRPFVFRRIVILYIQRVSNSNSEASKTMHDVLSRKNSISGGTCVS